MSESNPQHIKKIISIVDKTSPTFCLAKWHHVTLYLQTGETHSCYHPAPHKIELAELKKNPSALHNTSVKKQERKEMLEGVQTKGCQYCWNIENMGPDYISDRHIKTASIFTEKRYKQIINNPWDKNVNPEYIEISFGNECNFKCGYCHPKASSRFYNEIKQYGPVTSVINHRCDIDWMDLYEREEKNPYVDAWWKWWPTARKTLNILRITGGEPLMHVSTWKLLQSLKDDPMPKLELNVNSNLGVKSALVNKLITEVNYLSENSGFKRFKLFTSLDTWGPRAEYIRTGLDLKLWEQNFHAILSQTKFPITFMITFNILSVTTFKSLLEKILEWRKQYGWYDELNEHRIRFDTPYLKEPLQYDMNILPKKEFMPYMHKSLKFMEDNVNDADPTKFTSVEFEKFRRVVDYMASTEYSPEKTLEGQKDFYNWFNELDTRRGTDFVTTFPEMEKFYNKCGKLK
jgi:organic radical activating enzyme